VGPGTALDTAGRIRRVLTNLAVTAALVLVLMLGAFLVGVRRRRHDGVDVVWGLGFVLIAVVTSMIADGPVWRRVLVTSLVAVWGLRLAWYIGRRNHGQPEDRRYQALLARAPGNPDVFALYSVYLTQGAVMWVVSLPIQLAQFGDGAWLVVPFGVALWLVGFGFEAIGDAQLARFTADSSNRRKVLDTGLWRYTRHPNYFGDTCVWWGFFVLACHMWLGLVTVVGPAAITYLLTRVTGKPLLEKSIRARRPAYAEYVARTSGFFPLPRKKG
jgi:steroid 5-alpha reductase family enzyme